MALIIKDRVRETTITTGQGAVTLAGASTGFRSFADIGNGNTTYYCISNNNEFEVGVGTYTASGTTLSRDTVLSNSLGTTAKINFSAGTKDVFCTYPSGVAVANTAIGSPFVQSTNINNVGIGTNSLNSLGVGVATITVTNGGSGFYDVEGETDNFNFSAICTFVSGATATVYPTAFFQVIGGIITTVFAVENFGYGFTPNVPTVMTVQPIGNYLFTTLPTLNVGTYISATNNTALGYNSGNTNLVGSDSIYIGTGATGTGTNEIVIGANATGLGDNTVVIGNASTINTILKGAVAINNASGLSVTGGLSLFGINTTNSFFHSLQTSGTMTIGGASATGSISLGRSTGLQTVNIQTATNSSGAVNIGGTNNATGTISIGRSIAEQTVNIATGNVGNNVTKTVNIGTNTTNSSSITNINIGNNVGVGTINLGNAAGSGANQIVNIATGTQANKTLNFGTNSNGTTSIAIGSTLGTSTTTLNGNIIMSKTATPASATATGTTGTIVWDANYIYVCIATNTWKRMLITTW
jgi:hypothetical protein